MSGRHNRANLRLTGEMLAALSRKEPAIRTRVTEAIPTLSNARRKLNIIVGHPHQPQFGLAVLILSARYWAAWDRRKLNNAAGALERCHGKHRQLASDIRQENADDSFTR